jgi:predicted Fe-Mo cluster-binding NifX family protein
LFNMKIAIPLTAGRLSDHFGHCEQFALIEADLESKQILTQTMVVPPPHEPGVLPRWLHEQGAQVVIAGGMGRRALDLFAQNSIAVHAGAAGDTPENIVRAFMGGALGDRTPACGHDHGHSHDACEGGTAEQAVQAFRAGELGAPSQPDVRGHR